MRKENFPQNEYRTGSVPSAHSVGLYLLCLFLAIALAFLLAALNYLPQAVSAAEGHGPVAFLSGISNDRSEADELYFEGEVQENSSLGIVCQRITPFCEKYYDLPRGLYILRVLPDSKAAAHGLLPGDILTQVGEIPVQFPATLEHLLAKPSEEEDISLTVFRRGQPLYVLIRTEELQ